MSRNSSNNSRAGRFTARRGAPGPGVQQLGKAADDAVADKGSEIADALAKESLKGNASSAQILFDLALSSQSVEGGEEPGSIMYFVENWRSELEKDAQSRARPKAGNPPRVNQEPPNRGKPDAN
ncbi:MAG TPA: hypothetical protein VKB38_11370 [Terracidiphilus sp.]|nr:hypothetical protein [Terracidiphilus sp.]